MDGRDELGVISATPPVAAAFSSSLIGQGQGQDESQTST